ncbi:YIP1 family protein [Nitratidesulfovibrio sp. 1201_IL3209]|uniref:YIP1 family protein n=1 Tax=Nitratidesulfovibrio sp. 1201_IL3209 TaxID=3084053 RepID=UPI002FDB1B3B
MIIRCPECQFERSIDSSKIPSSAAIATCPKCRHRFRFRALAPDEAPDAARQASTDASSRAAPANAAAGRATPAGQDDAMPPAASADAAPGMARDEDDGLPAAFRRRPSAPPATSAHGAHGAPGAPGTEDEYVGEDDHVGEPRPVSGATAPHASGTEAPDTEMSGPDAGAPRAPGAPDLPHGHTDLSRPGDDPLPPGAVIPGRGRAPAPDDDHDGRDDNNGHDAPANGQRRPGSPRDIWDAVASVGDRWRKQSGPKARPGDERQADDRGANGGHGAPHESHDAHGSRQDSDGHGDPFPPRDGQRPDERDAPRPPWAASARSEVPWENLDRLGFFPGLYQTILRVMLAAPRFFAGVRSSGSLKRPVTFYLLIGIFQALTERLWYLMSMRAFGGFIEDPQLQAWMGSVTHDMSLPMTLLLSPFTLLLQLAVLSGLYHFMIRLVEPRAADLPTTVRVISYSAAPTVLSVVPLVGPVVGSLWFVVCTFVGVKYAHRLPWSRTALAIGPLLGLGFALTVQLLRMFMSSAPM